MWARFLRIERAPWTAPPPDLHSLETNGIRNSSNFEPYEMLRTHFSPILDRDVSQDECSLRRRGDARTLPAATAPRRRGRKVACFVVVLPYMSMHAARLDCMRVFVQRDGSEEAGWIC